MARTHLANIKFARLSYIWVRVIGRREEISERLKVHRVVVVVVVVVVLLDRTSLGYLKGRC